MVEVAISMTILGAVIAGAFYVSNKALQVGRDSKQRLQASTIQMRQAEALRAHRDDLGWTNFHAMYAPHSIPVGPNPCASPDRFIMSIDPITKKWTPVFDPPSDLVASVFTQCVTVNGATPDELTFNIYTNWTGSVGIGASQTVLTTKFADVFTINEPPPCDPDLGDCDEG